MLKILILMLLMLTGCLAEVTVKRTDPKTGYITEATYKRWGNQEFGVFTLNLDGTLSFSKQKSDNTAMYETFNKLIDRIP